jgi:hypothetical protein
MFTGVVVDVVWLIHEIHHVVDGKGGGILS